MDKIKHIIARQSTAAGESTLSDSSDPVYVYNPQLKLWKDADNEYNDYIRLIEENEVKKDEWTYIISIVVKLGTSLAILFGANYDEKKYTPPLRDFIDKVFVKNGWNLELDDPQLYCQFINLDNFYTDKIKHYSLLKIPEIQRTTIDDLNNYMETTKNMWLWYMGKINNGIVTPDMKREFLKKYI